MAIATPLMGAGRLEKNLAAGSTTRSMAVRAGTSVPPISSWRSPKAACARVSPPWAVSPKASPAPPALASRAAMMVSRSLPRSPVRLKSIPSSLSARALPRKARPMDSDAETTSRPVRMAKSFTRGNSRSMASPVRSKRASVPAAAARRSSSVPVSDCSSDARARIDSMGTFPMASNFRYASTSLSCDCSAWANASTARLPNRATPATVAAPTSGLENTPWRRFHELDILAAACVVSRWRVRTFRPASSRSALRRDSARRSSS